jgi:hypothetical protein
MLRRTKRLACPFLPRQDAKPGGWRNLPTNCQAQDISKYRFTLLRAILRNASGGPMGSLDGGYKGRVRRYRASASGGFGRKGWNPGGRIQCVLRTTHP